MTPHNFRTGAPRRKERAGLTDVASESYNGPLQLSSAEEKKTNNLFNGRKADQTQVSSNQLAEEVGPDISVAAGSMNPNHSKSKPTACKYL